MASATKNAVSRKLLAPGIKNLRNHLQSEADAFRRTPVLLISSDAGSSSTKLKPVAESCKLVHFTLGQQFGMRTVPTTISSAFPTKDSLEQTLELMQRTGASSVVSVGSGAAMDLGKAVQANLDRGTGKKNIPLILIPSTYGGLLAAGASHSLFLDGDEETLVPLPLEHQEILETHNGTCTHATISTLEPQKYIETLDAKKFDILLFVVSAILLDTGLREITHPLLPILLQDTIDLISSRKNLNSFDMTSSKETVNEMVMPMVPSLMNLLYKSSALLSYGLSDGFEENNNRSLTIALGSSLIPTLFPETHPMTFIASLVPGICHHYSEEQHIQSANDEGSDTKAKLCLLVDQLQEQFSDGKMGRPPSLTPCNESLQGFSVPDMALSHIQTNQAVWKPLDFPDNVLLQVLQHCIKQ